MIFLKWLEFRQFRATQKTLEECMAHRHSEDFIAAKWQQSILEQFFSYIDRGIAPNQKLMQRIRHPYEMAVDKNVQTILILAGLAPLLGLLGTVFGMIATFDVISEFGTGNSKAMANGISQALITTQTGLVVAVPGLFVGNILKRKAGRFKEDIVSFCFGLLMENADSQPVEQGNDGTLKDLS
jgi:biopolymer transport protein ExbB